MTETIFHKQSIILKLCLLFLSLILIFFLKTVNITILVFLNILYFIPSMSITMSYIRFFFKLSYFIILILLLGMVFNFSFDKQIELLVKIIFTLQIFVYLYKSYVNKIMKTTLGNKHFFSFPNLYLFYLITSYTLFLSI